MNNADDDFDFDDDGLDNLPADALEELEFTAMRATQHQNICNTPAAANDYEEEDEDEVIDLRDQGGANIGNRIPLQTYNHGHGYSQQHNGTQNDAMDIDEPPRRSQADPNQLLLRIRKV